MRPGRAILIAAIFAGSVTSTGCSEAQPVEPMSRETFIEVVVALRQANREETSADAFLERKREILEQAGVTDSGVVEYARIHESDIAFMAATWDSIARRLREGDTVPR